MKIRKLTGQTWLIIVAVVAFMLGAVGLGWSVYNSRNEARDSRRYADQQHSYAIQQHTFALQQEAFAKKAVQDNNLKSCQAYGALAKLPTDYPVSPTITATGLSLIKTLQDIQGNFAGLYGEYRCQPPLKR